MQFIDASDMTRIMRCHGSRFLAHDASANQASATQIEGIAAHEVTKLVLQGIVSDPIELVDRNVKGYIVTPDMAENLSVITAMLMGYQYIEHECQLIIQDQITIACRVDYGMINDTDLFIGDLKYGWKLKEPEYNWTLICYAMGLIKDQKLNPKNIHLTIYQPRPYHPDGNIRTWSITYEKLESLYQFMGSVLIGNDHKLSTGDHCYRCPSAGGCPALRESNMTIVDITTVELRTDRLPNEVISYELKTLERAGELLKTRYNALLGVAEHKLRNGEYIEDFALTPIIGNKTWNDNVTVDLVNMLSGVDVRQSKLVTPGQAKKLGVPEEIVESLTTRPSKGFRVSRQNLNTRATKILKGK